MKEGLGFTRELTCVHQVADLSAAVAWYGEVLGFPSLFQEAEVGYAELTTHLEGVTIGLSQVEEPEHGGGAVLTFSVEDVEAARARLEARDVRFDGKTREVPGLVRLATFYDPDGNAFMLAEDLR